MNVDILKYAVLPFCGKEELLKLRQIKSMHEMANNVLYTKYNIHFLKPPLNLTVKELKELTKESGICKLVYGLYFKRRETIREISNCFVATIDLNNKSLSLYLKDAAGTYFDDFYAIIVAALITFNFQSIKLKLTGDNDLQKLYKINCLIGFQFPITELEIYDCKFEADVIEWIVINCTNLHSLHVDYTYVKFINYQWLLEILSRSSNICNLSIINNNKKNISRFETDFFSNIIEHTHKTLRNLVVDGDDFYIDEELIEALQKKKFNRLRKLTISNTSKETNKKLTALCNEQSIDFTNLDDYYYQSLPMMFKKQNQKQN